MSTLTTADDVTASPRPRAATGPGAPLRSELSRLLHRRLVVALLALGALALVVATVALFATHGKDVAGARVKAQADFQQYVTDQRMYYDQCVADPTIPDDQLAGACGTGEVDDFTTADSFFVDPRLFADQGLPVLAVGTTVVGAVILALVGATGVGADWSSRTMVSLLTWQPRRLRFLATRLGAVALLALAASLVAQALALGLGALVVATRGTFDPTPELESGSYMGSAGQALISQSHFWRDLLSLQGRGVLLMVLAALVAAAIATITRGTGGFLGVALVWLVVIEIGAQALLASKAPALSAWTLTQSAAAAVTPGGLRLYLGEVQTATGMQSSSRLVSNLEGLSHLGLLAVVAVLAAGLLLRRRDL